MVYYATGHMEQTPINSITFLLRGNACLLCVCVCVFFDKFTLC